MFLSCRFLKVKPIISRAGYYNQCQYQNSKFCVFLCACNFFRCVFVFHCFVLWLKGHRVKLSWKCSWWHSLTIKVLLVKPCSNNPAAPCRPWVVVKQWGKAIDKPYYFQLCHFADWLVRNDLICHCVCVLLCLIYQRYINKSIQQIFWYIFLKKNPEGWNHRDKHN